MPATAPQAPIPRPAAAPRVVLVGGFDDAARARWVRRLLGEIAAHAPETCCTLVRAGPGILRPGPEKDPAPVPLSPVTHLSPVTQLMQSTQSTQPAQLTLLERRPPCLCCPDAGLVDELTRLASPLASPLAAPRPACAWLIVEIPAATLVWTCEELRRTLPSSAPRLFTVMVRRLSAANNGAGTALWNLPGLADFDVFDESSAANAIRAIARSDARGD